MISKTEMEFIKQAYVDQKEFFEHNYDLLEIYEGDLKSYVEKELKLTFSPQAYQNMCDRIAPINILTKIVDKCSTIYSQPPVRRVLEGNEQDQELVSWFESEMYLNDTMQDGTELFNLSKSHLLQPYVDQGIPKVRAIPNDRFFVMGLDPVNPMRPTHVVHFDIDAELRVTFYAYTDTSFTVFNDMLEVRTDIMASLGNVDGINPYGKIPFVYSNASRFKLMPSPDSDVLTMTVLLPILISDLNYATKFQCFSIIYGIDVNDENLKMAPNAFWRFKSDQATDKTPSVGSIKPQVDTDQALTLIQSQIALWLNTRGIRPGAVGQLTKDNFSSGISKIVDEMDTLEYRQKLIGHYTKIECELWNLIMHHMHPVWSQMGLIENTTQFTAEAEVSVIFTSQLPAQSRADLVQELKAEVEAGFLPVGRAVKRLNPELDEEEIDELMAEIQEERTIAVDNTPFEDQSTEEAAAEEPYVEPS